jgi:hypothetical protein
MRVSQLGWTASGSVSGSVAPWQADSDGRPVPRLPEPQFAARSRVPAGDPGPGHATSLHKKTAGKVAFSRLIMGSDAAAVVHRFCQ